MENYVILREIGRGAHGRAFKAISSRNNTHVVIKQVSSRGLDRRQLLDTLNEISVLRSLNHPNIIRHIDNFRCSDHVCIVMEYAASGDLSGRIKSVRLTSSEFNERQISAWLKQLLSGLSFLHSRCIIHRDLKPQNIFVNSTGDRLMIGDFGVCKVLESKTDLTQTMTGTPYYLSPEIFQGRPYSTKSDIWSLGCIIFELAALKVPFEARDFHSLGILITRGGNPPFPPKYSKDLREIFLDTMRRDFRSRPDAEHLLSLKYFQNAPSDAMPKPGRVPSPLRRPPLVANPSRSLSPYRILTPHKKLEHVRGRSPSTAPIRGRSASPYSRVPTPSPRKLMISPTPHTSRRRLRL